MSDELSRTLRELRGAKQKTLDDVATAAGVSRSTVSRIETGKYVPSPELAAALARATGAPAATRRHLVQLAEDLRERTTPRQVLLRGGPGRLQDRIRAIETTSGHVQTFHPAMVTGLLQTEDYARAVFRSGGLNERAVEDGLRGRLDRAALLGSATAVTQVMTWGALTWCVTSPAVMAAQLDHIAELAERGGNITIGIIPWSRPVDVFPMHGFDLYDERAAIVGVSTGTQVITRPPDVQTYVQTFRDVLALADTGPAAAEHARAIADDYRSLPASG